MSVDDTAEIVEILRDRFPAIEGPAKEDICYATTNRQAAVKAVGVAQRAGHRGRRAEFIQFAFACAKSPNAPARRAP